MKRALISAGVGIAVATLSAAAWGVALFYGLQAAGWCR
jgi:hypothetical protein